MFTTILIVVFVLAAAYLWRLRAKLSRAHAAATEAHAAALNDSTEASRRYGNAGAVEAQAVALLVGNRRWVTLAASVFTLLAVITAISGVTTVVGTKDAGIELTLQRPSGTLDNGFHLKAPWQSVVTMDAAIQTDNHVRNGGRTSDGQEKLTCIGIRIAHQATACVDASIRWQIIESQAGQLYQSYRGFSNVRDSLVTRDLNTALAQEMEGYDALAIDEQGVSTAPAFSTIATSVVADMNRQAVLNGHQLINVLSISIPVVTFDAPTQAKIQQIQSQIAATRVAQQAKLTADAQAAANRALAASVNNNPGVLQSKCLDIVSEAIDKGRALPAGFTCLGGPSVSILGK